MEIDLGTTLVGVVGLAIFALPFVYDYRNRKKKERLLFQSLKGIAQEHNCEISQYEFCSDFIIGLDESKNFAFFYKKKEENFVSQHVDLSEIQTCHTAKKARTIKTKEGNLVITDRIELCFTPANNRMNEIRFELYDKEINTQLSGQLQLADKWVKQLNDRIINIK
ncbi:hypothetical protein [Negadavirga shengliensis]|uniref:Uncharacterized protein n=1 Tax=Negadavirga shengliensis TaxID=1389218 RepID=A0ABV9T9D5_9BACT